MPSAAMQKDGSGSGTGQGCRDFAGNDSSLAHSGENHLSGAGTEKLKSLFEGRFIQTSSQAEIAAA